MDARRWTPWAAALLPLAIYAWTAAGHGYWLDSAEFTAAAVGLDIAHPPGHPLFALWSIPFTWLPIGPLPFRIALGQAVAAAGALWFVQRALLHSLDAIGLREGSWIALAGSWSLAGAYGFWFQAVRAEVYALQALLVCIAFERVAAWACDREHTRALYGACLALGLGLANHHFIAVLAMPVLAWPAYDAWRRRGLYALGIALALGVLGCACYAYLPLRALAEPRMDLGDPRTLRDFFWVISAQVYARRIGTGAVQPLAERFADLLVILYEQLGVVLLPALLGGYAVLRRRSSWPLAYLWWSAALISLCGRAWLNEVRANPDVLGYMIPGFFALVALAALGVGTLTLAIDRTRWTRVLPLLAVLSFVAQAERSSLRDFRATDAFDDRRRRALPPRSVLVLTTPDSVFRHWEGEAVEQLRADVTMLPLPFLGYGGSDRVWLRRDPTLQPVADAFARDGALTHEALRSLARQRPVFVELDTSTTLPLYPYLAPAGLLYRLDSVPMHATPVEARSRAREQNEARSRAREQNLAVDPHDVETLKQLLWLHYTATLFYAAHGDRAQALVSAQQGLALAPHARELVALDGALRNWRAGGLDLRPFLPAH